VYYITYHFVLSTILALLDYWILWLFYLEHVEYVVFVLGTSTQLGLRGT
jgi:hypothetical protein